MNSLRLYSACKLTSQPDTVLWVLARNTKLMDQRQRTVIHSTASSMSFMFVSFPLESHRSYTDKPRKVLHTQCVMAQEFYAQGTPVFHNELPGDLLSICPGETHILFYWTVNKPALYCGRKHYFCCPRLFIIQTSLKRQSGTKASITSAHKGCRNMKVPWKIVSQQ